MAVHTRLFKYLAVLLCVLHGISVTSAAAAVRPWRSQNFTQTTKKYKGKPLFCFESRNRFSVGYKAKQGKKNVWVEYTSAADKRALKKLGFPAACQSIVDPGTTTPSPTSAPTIAPTTCVAALHDISIEVSENGSESITASMVASNFCGGMELVILDQPSHGTTNISASAINYKPATHYLGSDSIRVGLSSGSGSAQVTLNVVAAKTEFAGDPDSLEPYREHLTPAEVRALLKRVALGGNETFYNIGINQGRSALVEALLTTQTAPEIKELSESVGELMGNPKDGAFPTVTGPRRMWEVSSTRMAWTVELLKGSPLHQVAFANIHDHFAANLSVVRGPDQIGLLWPIKDHYLKLDYFALGSLDALLRELNYDTVMGWSLDNRLNRWDGGMTGNVNYGREMLEKFTVGRFDMYAPQGKDFKEGNAPNYNEEDVAASAKILSGFYSFFEAYGLQPGFHNWNVNPLTGFGYEGMDLDFAVSAAFRDQIDIFSSRPEAHSFTIAASGDKPEESAAVDEYMDLLLYGHHATARRIAYSLFGRFAIPHPSESLTEELAQIVTSSHYDMTVILRRILNSSAMFTSQAMEGCVKSPVEHLGYVLRTLKLPMNTVYSIGQVANGMIAAGMPLFEPATVFGFHMCGDPLQPGKPNHGETWISAQQLLNRARSIFDILKTAQRTSGSLITYHYTGAISEPVEAVDLRTTYFGTWQAFTAAQVVDHMSGMFNLSLSAPERTLLINYMSAGDDSWNPMNTSRVQEKLRGLSLILAMHPKSIL